MDSPSSLRQPLRQVDASFSEFLRRCQAEEEEDDIHGQSVEGSIADEMHAHAHSDAYAAHPPTSPSSSSRPPWTRWLRPSPHPSPTHQHDGTNSLPSSYMALIPLSDSRLKPRPWLLILLGTLLVTCMGMGYIYFTVSRGVSVGAIQVVDSSISFDTAQGSYHIVLVASIPIFNQNYQEVSMQGMIEVSFYDQFAGAYRLKPVIIPRRSQPHNIRADINSSSLPPKWIFTLIFFLKSDLRATYLRTTVALPTIKGYAIVDCNDKPSGYMYQNAVEKESTLKLRNLSRA